MTWQLSNNVRDSVGFVFVFDDKRRGVHRARFMRSTWSKKWSIFVGAKSETFSLTRCAMAVARRALCSAWFPVRSFFSSMFEKSQKKGICFEFMLWILNEFLPCAYCAVFLQRGVLPDFDSNFLWMMVDWVFPFPRLVLAEQEPHKEAKTGRQSVVRRRCEGVRNNFSHAPDYAWTSFQKMGVRKLKICKFSLVSKICCFFGSLSCVFDSRWFDVWNAV